MTTTTFADSSSSVTGTLIVASWMNDVNTATYKTYVNPKMAPFNAVGDNVADDTAALQAWLNFIGTNHYIGFLPAGVYRTTAQLTATQRINILGVGCNSVIRNVGSGHALVLDCSADSTAVAMAGSTIRGIAISGAAGSQDGLRLININKGYFENIIVVGCGASGVHLLGTLETTFVNVAASVNSGELGAGTRGVMQRGFHLETANAIECNINVFFGCSAEGIVASPGIGLDILSGDSNSFLSFTTESNTIGLNISAGVDSNSFAGPWFEANGTDITGSLGTTTIWGKAPIASSGLRNFVSDLTVSKWVIIGPDPAQAGDIRMSNDGVIVARESGGTDRALMRFTTANVVELAEGQHNVLKLSGSDIQVTRPLIALGGGAAATGATVGGSGPASPTPIAWKRELDASGTAYFIPCYR